MGYAVGTACYPAIEDAAAMHCAAIRGVTAGGVVACESAAVSGEGEVSISLRTVAESGETVSLHVVQFPECEPRDLEYYAPALGAWWLALVVIVMARRVGRLFTRESL